MVGVVVVRVQIVVGFGCVGGADTGRVFSSALVATMAVVAACAPKDVVDLVKKHFFLALRFFYSGEVAEVGPLGSFEGFWVVGGPGRAGGARASFRGLGRGVVRFLGPGRPLASCMECRSAGRIERVGRKW